MPLFVEAVRDGIPLAAAGAITVFGIKPGEPSTAYGYIRRNASRVEAFVEKPDLETAKRYVAGGYLWNSGNFLFRADVMLAELARLAPDVLGPATLALHHAMPAPDGLLLDATHFASARRTSIDFAVMEKAANVAVVEGRFGWSDIGSFAAIFDALPHDDAGNAIAGDGHAIAASANLVHATGTRVIAAGVSNLAIIATRQHRAGHPAR